MKKIITLIAFVLFAFATHAQHVFDNSRTTIQTPPPAYDSTFHLEAPSREHIKTGQARWVADAAGGAELGYLVLIASISQNGTDTLALVIHENTIGDISSTRDFADSYALNCTGCFTSGKTWVMFSAGDGGTSSPAWDIVVTENAIVITGPNLLSSDTDIAYGAIEIRVYP